MNILQISQNHYVSGGSDSYFFAVSKLLREQSHLVVPFTGHHERNQPSNWSGYFPKTYREQKNKISSLLRYVYSPESRRSIHKLTQEIAFDIAHLHIYYGSLTASILEPLRQAGIPIVQTLHEYKLVCPVYTLERNGSICNKCVKGSSLNGIIHRCKNNSLVDSTVRVAENFISRRLGDVRNIDRFISVSNFHRAKMIEGGIPENKIACIHNFVDTESCVQSTEDEGYALYFGRVEKLKGINTLLHAFKGLPMKLVIAGEGSALAYFRAVAAELQLNNVEFVGFKSGAALDRLIDQSRFCIVPSEWYENCPMTVLEAMAKGKAVIGSRIGGIPELIRDGVDGYCFEPGSVDELRESCMKLSGREKALEMGLNARSNVEMNFSKAVHYKKIMDLYQGIAANATQDVGVASMAVN